MACGVAAGLWQRTLPVFRQLVLPVLFFGSNSRGICRYQRKAFCQLLHGEFWLSLATAGVGFSCYAIRFLPFAGWKALLSRQPTKAHRYGRRFPPAKRQLWQPVSTET
ncbi:hypothetical protein NPIL_509491 [Nephila pilipes]|uniref:Uncharacterized protein n=1 Tax=Nephila pilipes TaxID=299642 RepID=A0A8X6TAR9_NEPPI|nr:hypothetical protein NPIL_509491 [Nephila pilipes]